MCGAACNRPAPGVLLGCCSAACWRPRAPCIAAVCPFCRKIALPASTHDLIIRLLRSAVLRAHCAETEFRQPIPLLVLERDISPESAEVL